MSGVQAFIIIVLLPVLISLGHDIWISYEASGLTEFKLVSVGFVWTTYSPDSFKWAAQNLGKEYWMILNKILPMKTSIFTGILPAVALPILLFLRVFCLWPFQELSMTRPKKFRQRR